jgi:hypothetical protein
MTPASDQFELVFLVRSASLVYYCTMYIGYSDSGIHRLNMELDLQTLFGLLCTAVYSLAESPQLPAFGLIYEGANWSAKIDDISL